MRALRNPAAACLALAVVASVFVVSAPSAVAGDTHDKLKGSWELDMAATEKATRDEGKVPPERIDAMLEMLGQTASMIGWKIDATTMRMRRGDQEQVLTYTVDDEKKGKLAVTAKPPKDSGQPGEMKMTIVFVDDDHIMMQSGKPGDIDTIVWKRAKKEKDEDD